MIDRLRWEQNRSFNMLPRIAAGCKITLYADGAFAYIVAGIVHHVENDNITVEIVSVFDHGTNTLITGGDITAIVGKTITCKTKNVFSVR